MTQYLGKLGGDGEGGLPFGSPHQIERRLNDKGICFWNK
tara:strand:+ start:7328 stop:7444 length:117 start_codon:yes stop_codon:yes gene_type:complete